VRSEPLARAKAAHARGDRPAALRELERALAGAKDDGAVWLEAGALLSALGAHDTAIPVLRRAAALLPGSALARVELGMALARAGVRDEPARCYREAAALAPRDPVPRVKLGHTLARIGQLDEAEAAFREALALQPGDRDAAVGLAGVLEARRDADGAAALLQPHLGSGDAVAAITWGRVCQRLRQPEAALPVLRAALAHGADPNTRPLLLYALGDTLDALGEVDEAFSAFSDANRTRGLTFDPARHQAELQNLATQLTRERLASLPRATLRSEVPVLIVGMPRSGTTLLEQALARHPQVTAGGELEDLRDLAREAWAGPITATRLDPLAQRYLAHLAALGPGAARVTDKMPHNYLHLGLAALLLPQARVLHCVRDPVDTCWSCFRQPFGAGLAYTTNLAWLGAYHRAYEELMAHWRQALPLPMLPVRYEALVAEPEPVLREVLAFLGLSWEPACLRPERAERVAATRSQAEVQRPIHRESVGRAEAYRAHLGPLVAALQGGFP
jgi:tetratricopeptide (TPR) repeat protein